MSDRVSSRKMKLSKKQDHLTVRKCHFCQESSVLDGFRFCSACGEKQDLIFTIEVVGNHHTATSTSGENWKHIQFRRTKFLMFRLTIMLKK